MALADLAAFERGDAVWLEGAHPLPATVQSVNLNADSPSISVVSEIDQSYVVLTDTKRIRKRKAETFDVEDLTELKDDTDAAVLWTLKKRYDRGQRFTLIDDILVAINPYQEEESADELLPLYKARGLKAAPAHACALADHSLNLLLNGTARRQAIILTGETGSGKTELLKTFVQYLCCAAAGPKSAEDWPLGSRSERRAFRPKREWADELLAACCVLESFGNAKTTKNNNASRFGRYVDVLFKRGEVCGAALNCYLLEKNRCVEHATGERSFRVFYEMLAGVDADLQKKFGLKPPLNYFYLNQGKCIDSDADAEHFSNVVDAFETLGFSHDLQHVIYRILAAILHLGNVYFKRTEMDGRDAVQIGNESEIRWVSYLLQLDPDQLNEALTARKTTVDGEAVFAPLDIDQALDARDAIGKALYEQLFGWLTTRIKQRLARADSDAAIGVVDLFGFEKFQNNGFEQFCINLTAERLQSYFVASVFKTEQAEYRREKLQWADNLGEAHDNRRVVELLVRRPDGILPLLEDESKFPKASDGSFLQKCHLNHLDKHAYGKPRSRERPEFCVKHYAGPTWYLVNSFLLKNKDATTPDIVQLLAGSENATLSQMFRQRAKKDAEVLTEKCNYVGSITNKTMTSLMEQINECDRKYFVRCIRPNQEKLPAKMDLQSTLQQVRALCLSQAAQMRRDGYPVNLPLAEFNRRYTCLLPKESLGDRGEKETAFLIVTAQGNRFADDYQIGQTKVFVRRALAERLDAQRHDAADKAVIVIQKHLKGQLQRQRYADVKRATVRLQASLRGWKARKGYGERRREMQDDAQELARHSERLRAYEQLRRRRLAAADSPTLGTADTAVTVVDYLHMPDTLCALLSAAPVWSSREQPIERTVKCTGQYETADRKLPLPADLNEHPFATFVQEHFKGQPWQMRREPILTPFLTAENEEDFEKAVLIFKLILRFMNDSSLSHEQEVILANFIVQQGIDNWAIRDEIFVQLINQIHGNPSEANAERGWRLLCLCLSAFVPSGSLFKFFLNFVQNFADSYKALLTAKLLECDQLADGAQRTYPPSELEHAAARSRARMVLHAALPDGVKCGTQVHSWDSPSDVAERCLRARGIVDARGWTTNVRDGQMEMQLGGDEWLLDALASTELPSGFPAARPRFVVASNDPADPVPRFGVDAARAPQSQRKNSSDESVPSEPNAGANDACAPVISGSTLNRRYLQDDQRRHQERPADPGSPVPAPPDTARQQPQQDSRTQNTAPMHIPMGSRMAPAAVPPSNAIIYPSPPNPWIRPAQVAFMPMTPVTGSVSGTSMTGGGARGGPPHAVLPPSERAASSMSSDMPPPPPPDSTWGRSTAEGFYGPLGQPLSSASTYGYGRRVAPSDMSTVTSRIRRTKIPTKNSEVDKFLDDIFQPVLQNDGSMSECLYESRSLAASMKGGGDNVPHTQSVDATAAAAPMQPFMMAYPGGQQQMVVMMPVNGQMFGMQQQPLWPPMLQQPLQIAQPQQTDMPEVGPLSPGAIQCAPMQFMPVAYPNYMSTMQFGSPALLPAVVSPTPLQMQPCLSPSAEGAPIRTAMANGVPSPPSMPPEPSFPPPQPPPLYSTVSADVSAEERQQQLLGRMRPSAGQARYVGPVTAEPAVSTHIRKVIHDAHQQRAPQAATLARRASPRPPPAAAAAAAERADAARSPALQMRHFELEKQEPQPGRLPLYRLHDNRPVLERDAVELLEERSRRLPPPVDQVRYYPGREEQRRVVPHALPPSADSSFEVSSSEQPTPRASYDGAEPQPDYAHSARESDDWVAENEVRREPQLERRARQAPTHQSAQQRSRAEYEMGVYKSEAEFYPTTLHADAQKMEGLAHDVDALTAQRPKRLVAVTYANNTPWKLDARKEVCELKRDPLQNSRCDQIFFPGDCLDDPRELDLVFQQVVNDCFKPNSFRIRPYERDALVRLLSRHRITPESARVGQFEESVKRATVEIARQWPLYFCRFYPVVEERRSEFVAQLLGVSDSGVRLIARNYDSLDDPLRILDHFDFDDLERAELLEPRLLRMVTRRGMQVRVFSDQADQIKTLLDQFMFGQSQGKQFVRALADYQPTEPNLLSFRRGDVIQLARRDRSFAPADRGDWLYGRLDERFGNFPADYTEPLSADRHYRSPVAQQTRFNEVVDVGEYFQDYNTDTYRSAGQWQPDDGTMASLSVTSPDKLTMMEFALLHFRRAPPRQDAGGKATEKRSKKQWTWKDLADQVKFSKDPIQESLIRLENNEHNKIAVDCFQCIMRCMGDLAPKRGQTLTDCVYELLMACRQHPPLCDEVYCQLMRQTTNNKSARADSAIRGWRLFSLLAAYFACSPVLRPYLLKYLADAAADARRAFHGTALVCLHNFNKALRFGGRKFLLDVKEIEAITLGKNLKRQLYHLPGGHKKVINTKSVTVVEEIVQDLCQELNIRSSLEQQEFCLCCILEAESSMKLLSNDEYVLDVTTELEHKQKEYFLLLKRTVWMHPVRLDNELYIDVMFFQLVPDYLEGLLVVMRSADSVSAATMDDIAKLAALLHLADEDERADSRARTVSAATVGALLPRIVQQLRHVSKEQWAERVNQRLVQLPADIPSTDARARFLEILQTWHLFGSTFFYLPHVNDSRVYGECLLAINRHGVQFLHIVTHETLLEFRLAEVLSTHKVTAAAGGAPAQLLDLKVGNLLQQRVITLQTDQGSEISRLLGQYIYVDSQNRGYVNPDKDATNAY